MSDSMQTTVLGVDAEGRITADFTGGVVLHEADPEGPTAIDGIGWLDGGSLLRELIYGYKDGAVHQLLLNADSAGGVDDLVLAGTDGSSSLLQLAGGAEPLALAYGQDDVHIYAGEAPHLEELEPGEFSYNPGERPISDLLEVFHEIGRTPKLAGGFLLIAAEYAVTFDVHVCGRDAEKAQLQVTGSDALGADIEVPLLWFAIG